jgi:hypothetical protein
MAVPLIRPKVAELFFRLYLRPLHPELFEVLCSRTIVRDGYTLTVRLTRTGHALAWSDGRIHLEEMIATGDMDLPEAGRRLAHHFAGGKNARCILPGGVRYQVGSQLEYLPHEQFLHVHEELMEEGEKKGMVFHCKSGNRLGPSPLGMIIVQAVKAGLSANAFHTFPDELAIVKTQSLIEWGVDAGKD